MTERGVGFASGLRWVAGARIGAQMVSWVGTIYVMRLLSPTDYGLAAICTVVISAVTLIAEFGIGAGIVQSRQFSVETARAVFGASLLFGGASTAIVIALAPLAGWAFHAPEAVPLIQVSALQLLLAAFSTVPESCLKRDMTFRGVSVIEFVVGLAATIATVSLAVYGAGTWALVLGPLAGILLRTALLNALSPLHVWPSFRMRAAAGVINFGIKISLSRIASYIFGQADIVFASRFFSKADLGAYSVATHLALLPVSKLMSIINHVAFPAIAERSRQGGDIKPDLLRGLKLMSLFSVPLVWGLAAVAPWLIPLLLGPAWAAAIVPLQVICVALPFRLVNTLMATALQGMGHAGLDLQNMLTGIVILPLLFLFGVGHGPIGLAVAWLIGLPLLVIVNCWRSRAATRVGLREMARAISPALVLSTLMVFAVQLAAALMGSAAASVVGVASLVVLAAVIYIGLLFATDRPSFNALWGLVLPQKQESLP